MVKPHCHCSKTLLEKTTVKRVAVTKVGTPVAMTMLAGMVTNTFYNLIGRLKRVAPLEHNVFYIVSGPSGNTFKCCTLFIQSRYINRYVDHSWNLSSYKTQETTADGTKQFYVNKKISARFHKVAEISGKSQTKFRPGGNIALALLKSNIR